MFEVHISKHSPFRLKLTVGCPRCCGVLRVHEGVVLCGVLRGVRVVFCVGVGVWWWCCVVLCCVVLCCVVLCCVVLCCVVWCGVVCIFVFLCCFSVFLSIFFFLFLALSLSFFSLLSSLLSSLFSSSFSSLFSSRHQQYGKNRSTNTAANIEAFECDLAQGKCTAVGSLLPPLPSLLPSLPRLLKKKRGKTFYYRNISGEGIILHYSFILIQKNRRRVKLQSYSFILIRKQTNCNASNL